VLCCSFRLVLRDPASICDPFNITLIATGV